jgi:hypothetical protein
MMDLRSKHGEISFNNSSWGHLLKMAGVYGWEPAGTLAPHLTNRDGQRVDDGCNPVDDAEYEASWNGAYFYNEGQSVTDEDARNLANAIERALPDVPDQDVLGDKATVHPSGARGVSLETPVNPFEWFGGRKEQLRDFIVFCRAGGFSIS